MKEYTKAQISILLLDAEDILTASSPIGSFDDETIGNDPDRIG